MENVCLQDQFPNRYSQLTDGQRMGFNCSSSSSSSSKLHLPGHLIQLPQPLWLCGRYLKALAAIRSLPISSHELLAQLRHQLQLQPQQQQLQQQQQQTQSTSKLPDSFDICVHLRTLIEIFHVSHMERRLAARHNCSYCPMK